MWKKAILKDSIKLLNHWYISSVLKLSPVFLFSQYHSRPILRFSTSLPSFWFWDVHTQEPFVPLSGHSLMMMMMTYENKMFQRGHVCACVRANVRVMYVCVCVCIGRPIHPSIRSFIDHILFVYVNAHFCDGSIRNISTLSPCMGSSVGWPFEHRSLCTTALIQLKHTLCHIVAKNRLCRIFSQVRQVPFPIWTTRIYSILLYLYTKYI